MSLRVYRLECNGLDIFQSLVLNSKSNGPEDSWPPKIENSFNGANVYWTNIGYKKYLQTGLRDSHLSVLDGNFTCTIGTVEGEILYQNEYQVICLPSQVKVIKSYPFTYEGPRPALKRLEDTRPDNLRHYSSLLDWCTYTPYTGSDESFTLLSSVGVELGLVKIGIHREILMPNKRSSWPHAHKVEEELVYILKGEPDIWINGKIYGAKAGDFIFFPPGTNIAHSILNNTDENVEMMVLGEQGDHGDLIYYPLHPSRNEECKEQNFFWEQRPEVELGDHNGLPSKNVKREEGPWRYQTSYKDVQEVFIGDKSHENKVFHSDRDLGRALGVTRVALHHQVLPSGFRTSHPHAESLEEEFVYILKGTPIVWINGHRYQMREGDSVAFPSGTGIAHTFINESGEDVELLVAGETSKKDNLCSFPINPEMLEKSPIPWKDAPLQEIGSDSAMPETK
ncbi:cupin domain-containing protein [Bacteriovorax sp. BSW11_IV]|uniref:cupin domain-containing protein n=1 Tax=Bacteriovorax sp. BSW11_IV TaxID=1353529 RepID=UPI0006965AFA|nr:cupin domain-containing protein [Bacteriovorax sp. BSW11_IV]